MDLDKKKLHKNILTPSTFWDVNPNLLDAEKDKDFIIVRVLERGTDLEIMHIESAHSQQEIISALQNTRGVSKKTINFYKTVSV